MLALVATKWGWKSELTGKKERDSLKDKESYMRIEDKIDFVLGR